MQAMVAILIGLVAVLTVTTLGMAMQPQTPPPTPVPPRVHVRYIYDEPQSQGPLAPTTGEEISTGPGAPTTDEASVDSEDATTDTTGTRRAYSVQRHEGRGRGYTRVIRYEPTDDGRYVRTVTETREPSRERREVARDAEEMPDAEL